MKRIFKGPWLWILLAVVGVLLALQYLAPNGEYDEITTSQMNDYIAKGEVKEITFIDGDQEIQATLDDDVDRAGGNKVMTYWLTDTQASIENAGRRRRSTPATIEKLHDRGRPSRACSARSWRRSCRSC